MPRRLQRGARGTSLWKRRERLPVINSVIWIPGRPAPRDLRFKGERVGNRLPRGIPETPTRLVPSENLARPLRLTRPFARLIVDRSACTTISRVPSQTLSTPGVLYHREISFRGSVMCVLARVQVPLPSAARDVRSEGGSSSSTTLSHHRALQPDLQRGAAVCLRFRQQALSQRVRDEEGQLRVSGDCV